MTERTGLGPLEVALLRSVEAVCGDSGDYVPTARVLDRLERVERVGPSYGLLGLQDLGVWWRVPVRLFDLDGNWGSVEGDPMAEALYTKVRLSPAGALALAAEREEVGPVPVGLLNGSLYRGGRVPPLDPAPTLRLLFDLVEGRPLPGRAFDRLVRFPTGGTVAGDFDSLYDGRVARMRLGCRIVREETQTGPGLVITGTPPGVDVDEIVDMLKTRSTPSVRRRLHNGELLPMRPEDDAVGVVDLRDETSRHAGTRVVVVLDPDADVDAAEQWVQAVWPVTVDVVWQVPDGTDAMLRDWAERCRVDPSGLEDLKPLVRGG